VGLGVVVVFYIGHGNPVKSQVYCGGFLYGGRGGSIFVLRPQFSVLGHVEVCMFSGWLNWPHLVQLESAPEVVSHQHTHTLEC